MIPRFACHPGFSPDPHLRVPTRDTSTRLSVTSKSPDPKGNSDSCSSSSLRFLSWGRTASTQFPAREICTSSETLLYRPSSQVEPGSSSICLHHTFITLSAATVLVQLLRISHLACSRLLTGLPASGLVSIAPSTPLPEQAFFSPLPFLLK